MDIYNIVLFFLHCSNLERLLLERLLTGCTQRFGFLTSLNFIYIYYMTNSFSQKVEDLKLFCHPKMSLDWLNLTFLQCRFLLTYIDLKHDKNERILGNS